MGRPEISVHGSSQAFMQYYYLKDELVSFLRDNNLPVSGSKEVLKRRIADFIDRTAAGANASPAPEQAGMHAVSAVKEAILPASNVLSVSGVSDIPTACAPAPEVRTTPYNRPVRMASVIGDDAPIGTGFVCSEAARAYFVSRLGRRFTFKVAFQKWLKDNPEATFSDACSAYKKIVSADKDRRRQGLATCIGPQFEYNAYVRAFFADNPGSTLADAIKCWKHKKDLPGPHKYAPEDVAVLDKVTRSQRSEPEH